MFIASGACAPILAEIPNPGKEPRRELSSVFLDHYRISRPMAADDYTRGVHRHSRAEALGMRNIQVNPSALIARLVVDVDHDDAVLRAFRSDLPSPSWVAESPSGRAHVGYLLAVPVNALRADRRVVSLAAAVEEGLRRELGGDPAYGGTLTKNPLHPDWDVRWGSAALHTLAGMAEQLGTLPSTRKRTGKRSDVAGLGRNCQLFEETRLWSYDAVRRYWEDGAEAFQQAVHDHVLILNKQLTTPLPAPEVRAIAKSISAWTWDKFTPEKFRALQTARSSRGNQVKTERALERERKVNEMRGLGMRWQDIADTLGMSLGAAQKLGARARRRES